MNKRGISLVGINDITTLELIRTNYENSWFELSYASTKEQLHEQLPIIKDRIASIHMLCPQREYFPNIASKKAYNWSETEILKDAELALKIGAKVLVLHPGYLLDALVYTDNDKRMRQLRTSDMHPYMLNGSTICTVEYIKTEKSLSFEQNIEELLFFYRKYVFLNGFCYAVILICVCYCVCNLLYTV